MAGNGPAPRRRNFYLPPEFQPDLQMGTEDLAPGGAGGLAAAQAGQGEFIERPLELGHHAS
eukprot:2550270-Pyramimonas_sp.AAC.1